MKKITLIILLFLIYPVLAPKPAKAVACTEPSPTGDYAIDSDCTFAGTDDGVESGNITINSNVTLTINADQYVIWNDTYSIIINGTIQNSGGSLFQDTLWAVDAEGDGYPAALTWYRDANKPGGAVRVNTLASRTEVDCDDAAYSETNTCYSYAQGGYWRYGYSQGGYWRYSYSQSGYWRYGYSEGGYCFLEGTKVTMANGSLKNIQDIKPGDIILSYNLETKDVQPEIVSELLRHPETRGHLLVNGHLKTTGNHPVWLVNKEVWTRMEDVEIGDAFLSTEGEVLVKSIKVVDGINTTYNLSLVGNNNNYFAGGILVHNGIEK